MNYRDTYRYWATLGSNGLLMPNRFIGFTDAMVEYDAEYVSITLMPKRVDIMLDCSNVSALRRVSISGDFMKDIFPKGSTGRGYRQDNNYRAMRLYFDEDYSGNLHCVIKRNLDNYRQHATARSKENDNARGQN